MSLNVSKLSFLHSTLNSSFLSPNYLYLAYAALHVYWKLLTLNDSTQICQNINKTQPRPQTEMRALQAGYLGGARHHSCHPKFLKSLVCMLCCFQVQSE